MIAAQSLDGFIARHEETGTDFCSAADRNFLREALRDFDSMVMGRRTFDTLRDRLLATTATQYLRKIQTRAPSDYKELEIPDRVEFTDAAPGAILDELARRGRRNCALLGGSESYTAFLTAGLVDELWLTLEPLVFGSGTPLATGALHNRFQLIETRALGQDTVLLRYAKK